MVSKDKVYGLNLFAKEFYEKQLIFLADEWFDLENIKRRIIIAVIINDNLSEIEGHAALELGVIVREAEEKLKIKRSLVVAYINDIGYVTGINYSGNLGANYRGTKDQALCILEEQKTVTIETAFMLFYKDKDGLIHKKRQ